MEKKWQRVGSSHEDLDGVGREQSEQTQTLTRGCRDGTVSASKCALSLWSGTTRTKCEFLSPTSDEVVAMQAT